MRVLSLFDGIACGRVALGKAGIPVDIYFSSEVDKKAIAVTQSNYPDTVQVGDVRNLSGGEFGEIDILMGGSPCQGFSENGYARGFDDDRSILFFDFARLLRRVAPVYFLFENVVPKHKDIQQFMSAVLAVSPTLVNSSLVSAQDRKRLYWTNILFESPKDKGIFFSHLFDGLWPARCIGRRLDYRGMRKDYDYSIQSRQYIECRRDDKANCLTTVAKDCVAVQGYFDGRKLATEVGYRTLSSSECENLQTIPVGYTSVLPSDNQRRRILGNAWTVDVIAHILSGIKGGDAY